VSGSINGPYQHQYNLTVTSGGVGSTQLLMMNNSEPIMVSLPMISVDQDPPSAVQLLIPNNTRIY
jgi:hypothetical protein